MLKRISHFREGKEVNNSIAAFIGILKLISLTQGIKIPRDDEVLLTLGLFWDAMPRERFAESGEGGTQGMGPPGDDNHLGMPTALVAGGWDLGGDFCPERLRWERGRWMILPNCWRAWGQEGWHSPRQPPA